MRSKKIAAQNRAIQEAQVFEAMPKVKRQRARRLVLLRPPHEWAREAKRVAKEDEARAVELQARLAADKHIVEVQRRARSQEERARLRAARHACYLAAQQLTPAEHLRLDRARAFDPRTLDQRLAEDWQRQREVSECIGAWGRKKWKGRDEG